MTSMLLSTIFLCSEAASRTYAVSSASFCLVVCVISGDEKSSPNIVSPKPCSMMKPIRKHWHCEWNSPAVISWLPGAFTEINTCAQEEKCMFCLTTLNVKKWDFFSWSDLTVHTIFASYVWGGFNPRAARSNPYGNHRRETSIKQILKRVLTCKYTCINTSSSLKHSPPIKIDVKDIMLLRSCYMPFKVSWTVFVAYFYVRLLIQVLSIAVFFIGKY